MKTVVFDLDGTLADTSADMIGAANRCFRAMGFADVLEPRRDRRVGLRGGRAMLSLGLQRLNRFDAAMVDHYYPVFLRTYGRALAVHTRFYQGALESVAMLRAMGYGVGICTNKPEALARQLLCEMGAESYFGALVGADTLSVRKPDPAALFEVVRRLGGAPGQTLLVGDSETDHNTARAACVPSILVTFGAMGEQAANLHPEALLSDYAVLPRLVATLIG
ncbi:MAG: HAD-IA family hydrolase [Rhodobacteraceae bacterium]|nr:HAD-IA family hydrolase [Paracoccaceae bacterium]